MKLSTLLITTDYLKVKGTLDKEIENLAYHSDKVKEKSLFFAIEGEKQAGKLYTNVAVRKGAAAIVYSGDEPQIDRDDITLIQVEDVRKTMAKAAAGFYGHPSQKLLVIGITGTKGKTTTSFIIRRILEEAGIRTGIIGTVLKGFGEHMDFSDMTTPESVDIQYLLSEMVKGGCKAVIMEVSSQGLKHNRVAETDFDIAVFTNISPDHISKNEHTDYKEYLACKRKLFLMTKRAVINVDQREWPQIIAGANLEKIIFYGKKDEADFCIGKTLFYNIGNSLTTEYIVYAAKPCGDARNHRFVLNMPGEYNVYNATAAVAVTRALGVPWDIIGEVLQTVSIPGRTEIVPYNDNFTVMIDYAHNGKAAENLLQAIKAYKPSRIIAVFGCGGNRDKNRRFEMAEAVSRHADFVIITSDNPRFESPEDIENDICGHMTENTEFTVIRDRGEAIGYALQKGQKGDIIIVMGKGHEAFQIMGDKKYHFDDKEEILKARERNVL